jgi:four helix bundle protein
VPNHFCLPVPLPDHLCLPLPLPVPVPVPVPENFYVPQPQPLPDNSGMSFDHERLDVYHAALDFVVVAERAIEHLPRGRSHLADQLHRAATSIVLNVAEGAGKYSKPDKRRFYVTARGSATESAAIFDILVRLGAVTPEVQGEAKKKLVGIASMLIKLAKSLEAG